MWELISKLIPAPVIMGLLIWGLICAIFLQPKIEQRRADLTYVPMCEAGHLPHVRSAPQTTQPTDGLAENSDPQTPVGLQIATELRNIFRNDNEDTYVDLRYGSVDACRCSVGVAYDRRFWPSLANVMLLGWYQPRSIAHFEVEVAKIKSSGICG